MAKFRADVDEVRYYPTLGITVAPADVVDLPDNTVAAGLTPLDVKSAKAVKADAPTETVAEPATVVEGA